MFNSIRSAATAAIISLSASAQDGSIWFDGISGRGTASGVGDLVTNSTWEAWVRLPEYSSTQGSGCVLFRWGMYSHGLYVKEDQGAPFMGMYSCAGGGTCNETPPNSMSEGRWHHLALVFGPEPGPSGRLYIDGALTTSCPPLPCDPFAGWETVLGAQGYVGYSEFLRGEIDEARISAIPRYTSNFTPSRRFDNDAATVGLWHFDEGGGGIAHDSSGQNRHFTLHGGYEWRGGVTAISNYCQPKLTSAGCVPRITSTGTPSVGATNDFTVLASNVAPGVFGVLAYGRNQANLPFAGGTMCVGAPAYRTIILPAQPPGGASCTGTLNFEFTPARMAMANLAAGDVVNMQVWTRDNGHPAPNNWGMTDGLRVTLLP
jgi:hypothetical protein